MNSLTILYFAQLREQRGRDEETVDSAAPTPAHLYEELSRQHGLSFPRRNLIVAINDEMAPWDALLHDGDRVVFLPPVSGGCA